jgi:hypothetical protein
VTLGKFLGRIFGRLLVFMSGLEFTLPSLAVLLSLLSSLPPLHIL